MLLGEQAVTASVGVAAGLGMGYGIAALLSRIYQWEMFRIPLVVSGRTYLFTVAVITLAALGSGLLVRRRLDRLDLIAVLKTRE
jgi:putative ABC transport system permease protein